MATPGSGADPPLAARRSPAASDPPASPGPDRPRDAPFAFVQFEFAFPLGPADGRYLRRPAPDAPPDRVIVLGTLGAPPRRLLRGRRPQAVSGADDAAAAVPTVRATVIGAEPFADLQAADRWLEALTRKRDLLEAEVERAEGEVAALLRAHRAAAADPHVRELAASAANVVRVGYGSGALVADGRYSEAYELPPWPRDRRRRGEVLAPQERLAAILSCRERLLVSEELVLRARTDLLADRPREAALQARIALEALLAELPANAAAAAGELAAERETIGRAANAALEGMPSAELMEAVAAAIGRMARILRGITARSARDA